MFILSTPFYNHYLFRFFYAHLTPHPFWKSLQVREHPAIREKRPLSRPLLRTFQHGRPSLKIHGYVLPTTQTNQPCCLPHELPATVIHLLPTQEPTYDLRHQNEPFLTLTQVYFCYKNKPFVVSRKLRYLFCTTN